MCRRVVNDMVDDMDMKRKKSMALMTGRADGENEGPYQRAGMQPQRSRSFKVLIGLLVLPCCLLLLQRRKPLYLQCTFAQH